MISMIVGYAHNRVIGKGGRLLWYLPSDLAYFKRITTGHTAVMGRATFDAIGHTLAQRRNIVLTRGSDIPGVEVLHSVDEVLALGDIFIIGGESLYRQFLDVADRLYITEIDLDIKGDTVFPAWDRTAFTLVSAQEGTVNKENVYPHTFCVYQRNVR